MSISLNLGMEKWKRRHRCLSYARGLSLKPFTRYHCKFA